VFNGLQQEVRQAFLDRPRLVEKAAGFRGLSVLTDASDPAIFLLITKWTDVESFGTWHRSEAHHQSHTGIPFGLKLDASFTSLTIGNSIANPAGIHNLRDALEDQSLALSRWLMESDTVFALLLAPDGTIRARNRAGDRIFAVDPEKKLGSRIWDYFACSNAQPLRERLADAPGQCDGGMFLNLTEGRQNAMTLEVELIRVTPEVLIRRTTARCAVPDRDA